MKKQNRLVLVNGMGYLFACHSLSVSLRVQYHVEVVEGDVNSCKSAWKYR